MAVLVGTLGVIGCDSDTGGGGGTAGSGGTAGMGGDGGTGGSGACTEGELCCIELCFVGDLTEELRGVCLDEYSDCLALGELTDAECEALAEETCTI